MRARRNTYSLDTEERAIIRTWGLAGDASMATTHYATTLDLTTQGLQVYSSTLLPVGEVLDIDVSLQGQERAHKLKGVARSVHKSDDARGYVILVDLIADNNAAFWRLQFH